MRVVGLGKVVNHHRQVRYALERCDGVTQMACIPQKVKREATLREYLKTANGRRPHNPCVVRDILNHWPDSDEARAMYCVELCIDVACREVNPADNSEDSRAWAVRMIEQPEGLVHGRRCLDGNCGGDPCLLSRGGGAAGQNPGYRYSRGSSRC